MSLPHRQLLQQPPLEVTREDFLEAVLDADELEDFLDAEDHHGYFHAGTQYRFNQGKRKASARRYDNKPGEACICLPRAAAHIPYYDPFLAAIVRHLQEEIPTHRIRLLCPKGHRDINIDRLLTRQGPGWRFVGWFWDVSWRPLILFGVMFAAMLLRLLVTAYSH
jgi:hypothetical protein